MREVVCLWYCGVAERVVFVVNDRWSWVLWGDHPALCVPSEGDNACGRRPSPFYAKKSSRGCFL